MSEWCSCPKRCRQIVHLTRDGRLYPCPEVRHDPENTKCPRYMPPWSDPSTDIQASLRELLRRGGCPPPSSLKHSPHRTEEDQ